MELAKKIEKHRQGPGKDRDWEVWWECENCTGKVGHNAVYCEWCGRKFK